jgi:hypothetical protein
VCASGRPRQGNEPRCERGLARMEDALLTFPKRSKILALTRERWDWMRRRGRHEIVGETDWIVLAPPSIIEVAPHSGTTRGQWLSASCAGRELARV